MDIQATNQQSISDDQELAKVLAGITQQADNPVHVAPVIDEDSMSAAMAPLEEPTTPITPQVPTPSPTPAPNEALAPKLTKGAADLEAIKQDALKELRPLVDKLDVPAEEKFDTYLLLLRSTDDAALIAPAFEAAHGIADEARRAQALLDVIKEIDYLSAAK
jgi:hypothetical protein